jgi:hypothetical protein
MKFEYIVNDVRFVWEGGAYIEMFINDKFDLDSTPFDVINVWDYEWDWAKIPKEIGAFIKFVNQYVKEEMETAS